MSQQLEGIFAELGLSQYLDTFVDQGFDSWDTILDITESDLDVLGVKLGHRRKLQRRIANTRGLAPDASLQSPTRASIEDPRADSQRHEADDGRVATVVVTKRKYRRHPKPDENAPERPPSAYVLFSNKMRDDLKGRNLTFTEIAKLVGENWQNLSPVDKEPFEGQAQLAKDKYNRDLGEYKKTADYRKYTGYLQEFKAKHSNQKSEREAAKRVKLSDSGGGGGGGGRGVSPQTRGTSRSGTGSDGEAQASGEPSKSSHPRLGSIGGTTGDNRYSPPVTPVSQAAGLDSTRSPSTTAFSAHSPTLASLGRRDSNAMLHERHQTWSEIQRADGPGPPRHLPSLSDMFDARTLSNGSTMPLTTAAAGEAAGFPFPYHRRSGSPGSTPSLVGGGDGRTPPPLRHEQSSAGSVSSATSASASLSHPRTPLEGPLPIHALLAGRPGPDGVVIDGYLPYLPPVADKAAHEQQQHGVLGSRGPLPYTTAQSFAPILSGAPLHISPPPINPGPREGSVGGGGQSQAPPPREGGSLDGMSALLRAGEIVGRRPR